MPAYLVHRIAGESVLRALPRGAVPQENPYVAGLQGGDIFFAYRFRRPRVRRAAAVFGSLLHGRRTRDFFVRSVRHIREYAGEGRDALVSYFCGYIVHYCVDKAVHPFVFARAPGLYAHNRLEFELDALYVRDAWGMDAADFDIAADMEREPLNPAVGAWYARMDAELYAYGLGKDMAARALRDFARLRRALRRPGALFTLCCKLLGRFTRYDARIFMHPKEPTWAYFDPREYEQIKAWIDGAVAEAVQKIRALISFLRGETSEKDVQALFEDVNFRGEKSDSEDLE